MHNGGWCLFDDSQVTTDRPHEDGVLPILSTTSEYGNVISRERDTAEGEHSHTSNLHRHHVISVDTHRPQLAMQSFRHCIYVAKMIATLLFRSL